MKDELEKLPANLVAEIMSQRLGYEVTIEEVLKIKKDIEENTPSELPDIDELELSETISKLKKLREIEYWGTDFRALLSTVIDTLVALGHKVNSCDITFAHTKHWCGHPLCRES
jgi:hypothetical protein